MLSTLRTIIHKVNAANGLQDTFDIIVTEISEAMETDICSVYLKDKETNNHLLVANYDLKPEINCQNKANHQNIINLISLRKEPLKLAEDEALEAFLGVPIIHHREGLGVLVVQQKSQRVFSKEDESFLITLSAQLAGIIANVELRNLVESKKRRKAPTQFTASSSTPGLAMGKGWVVSPPTSLANLPVRHSKNTDHQIKILRKALSLARKDIRGLAATLSETLAKQEFALFNAYEQMLSHNSLGKKIEALIKTKQLTAPSALSQIIDDNVKRFSAMEDPYLRERSTDILDLGRRVLTHINEQSTEANVFPKKTILISEQVTSGMIAEVPPKQLLGIISLNGSASSHAAILAKSMGIPALMGLRDCPISALEGKALIIDGYKNLLFVKPMRSLVDEYKQIQISEQQMLKNLQRKSLTNTKTADGLIIPLMVNSGMLADVQHELKVIVDGVGLFRSEYLFMQNQQFPSEEEQRLLYRSILKAYQNKPVVIRTLDIGGDKTLSYFPIKEENPFLGWRGIRITLDHPEIFNTQIRAMMLANVGIGNLQISLPMISTLSEIDESLILIRQVYNEIKNEFGLTITQFPFPKIGVVIEVPSAVYQVRSIAKRVDFLTIGSNDLTQYMFAVDRNNTRVSYLYKSLHPAILLAILEICEAGNNERIPVHVCGEIAGDPIATIVLLAMGVSALSMNIHSIPKVRKVIQKFKMSDASEILSRTLSFESAFEIREYLTSILEGRGLGELINPGHH